MEKKATNQIQSAADIAIDDWAKQEEELRKLEEELADSKYRNHSIKCFDVDKEEVSEQGANPESADKAQNPATEEEDPDKRSVFVKNVDFSADDAQLTEHFKECGEIVRVTIRKNPHTQQSLG